MVVPPLLCSLWSILHFFVLEFGDVSIDDCLKVGGAIVALGTIWVAWRGHEERAMFDMIDRLYSLCHTLEAHLLTDWQLSHLFAITPGEYERVKKLIQSSVTAENRAMLKVRERLFAIHVFIVYEQIYYQWRFTRSRLHPDRADFLEAMLRYFTCRLLKNPRLLAFRTAHPGGHVWHMEPESALYLEKCLPKEDHIYEDNKGPFEE